MAFPGGAIAFWGEAWYFSGRERFGDRAWRFVRAGHSRGAVSCVCKEELAGALVWARGHDGIVRAFPAVLLA